jgi:DNA-binding MarR family transcriptional regulator
VTLLEITQKGRKTLKHIENEKDNKLKRMLTNLSRNEKIELLEKTRQILRNGLNI